MPNRSFLFSLVMLAACGPAVCGNEKQEEGETCDDGNNIDSDGCNTQCTTPICGNNITDSGETCDDGNTSNGDGCGASCQTEACGDGITQITEQCDDSNTNNGDGCSDSCQNEFCGDGAINDNGAEECDDGPNNSNTTPDACRIDCTAPICGDTVTDSGETCDDGNTSNDDSCRNNCTLPGCGDGILDDGETCDDGGDQGFHGCRDDCSAFEVCGDSSVDVGELCDDGNIVDGDGCRSDCLKIEECGDLIVDAGEDCDDGNLIEGDGCNSLCTFQICGNALLEQNEICDDGNTVDGDGCRGDCQKIEVCGDLIVDAGEGCDDGNFVGGDGCAADCSRLEVCGDAITDVGETCDDGNTNEADGCDQSCESTTLPLRIMAANITSGNFQSYDLGHGTRIFQAMNADVVLVQEFNFGNNSEAALRGYVDNAFGPEYFFFRENRNNGDIPNGVVSRFPILEAGEFDDPEVNNRDFVFARLDLPNTSRDLWVISLHLLTSGGSRPAEATALVAAIQANIPDGDFLVLGGDLNTSSRTETAMNILGAEVLIGAPHPADQNGNTNTSANRNNPFDWVLTDSDLDIFEVPVVIGPFTFTNGLVFDSRLFSQAELNASFSPVLVADSGAPSMQHMAVIRDFFLPVE
jgi:cysteine-rich repeat protein